MKPIILALSLSCAALAGCAAPQTASEAAPAASAPAASALTVDSTIAEIAAVPAGRALLEREYTGLSDGAMVQGLRFRTIAGSMGLSDEQVASIDAELRAIQR